MLMSTTLISHSSSEELQRDLLDAAADGNIAQVKELIKKGARLNPMCPPNYICQPLPYASENGDISMMQLLIDEGADVNGRNAYGDTPLIYALGRKQIEAVKLLIKSGADVNQPNAFGITPFMGVCAGDNIELVKLFAEHGGDPNLQFEDRTSSAGKPPGGGGVTALMMAAEYGTADIVKLLMDIGADKNLKDAEGLTALDCAKKSGDAAIMSLLNQ